MWIQSVLEIMRDGKGIGKYRLTARSDEDGGGPYGGCEHEHDTREEAEDCVEARIECGKITGFPATCDEVHDGGTKCENRLGHDGVHRGSFDQTVEW